MVRKMEKSERELSKKRLIKEENIEQVNHCFAQTSGHKLQAERRAS